jgi:outer membrane protein
MNKFIQTTIATAIVVFASSAFAQKAGDNIVSLGIASINPDAQLGTVTSASTSSASAAAFTAQLKGASANVSSATTISFGLLHMYTDNIGGEFTIGVPAEFTQDLNTPNGTSPTHPAAAKMKIWTPTVVAKYFFGTPQDKWRPYLGLGVSRVSFHNVSINSADTTVQALAGTSASLSSSFVPVYNAGLLYNIDDKWSVSGSVAYLPIKSTTTFVGPGLGVSVTSTGDTKLNTTDYVVRLGYKF